MLDTMEASESALLARVAAGLNGGRFVSRITDEAVKAEALALVAPVRAEKARLNARKRQAAKASRDAYAKALDAARVYAWKDYSVEDASRVEAVFAIFGNAPKRSLVRDIFRVIVLGRIHVSTCNGAECDGCRSIPADWRSVVRAYRDARIALKEVGHFPISRFDMTADGNGRFYRSVVSHWHSYAGGRHVAIHGVTPDDILQDALLSAIESGDVTEYGVPTFGPMYMHTRRATESAVFNYRRVQNNPADFPEWTWADWKDWAVQNGADRSARVWSTNEEWNAYDAARKAEEARIALAADMEARRNADMVKLDQTRASLAALILGGMTVRRVANLLGRTVEAIAADIERSEVALAPTFV